MPRFFRFWETRWWHQHVLGHNVKWESEDLDFWQPLFDSECSCGTWFFRLESE